MLFNVHVVSEEEYHAYLKTLIAAGQTGEGHAVRTLQNRARGGRMTTLERAPSRPRAPRSRHRTRQIGTVIWKWVTTTDHKVIGNLYFVTSLAFFFFGGMLALAIRAELAFPGLQYLSYETYNQFFTMHGAIMLLLFATPLFAGFANAIMPLQIGAPDVAFPRLNMFSYWTYLFGGRDRLLRLPHPGRRRGLRLVRLHPAE